MIIKKLAAASLVTVFMSTTAMAATYHFKLVDKISLPGQGGHGDWVEYDPGNGYVYIALADKGVAVVDTASDKVVHYLPSLDHPEGEAADANYVYFALGAGAGKTNELAVISKATWQVVSTVNTAGTSPDGVQIDTVGHKVLVESDDANTVEVYNEGPNPKLQANWSLIPATGSGPDVGMYVASKDKLYMPDDSQEELLDAKTGKIVNSVDTQVEVTQLGGTKGQIYDPKTNDIWVGTTSGGVFVYNADTLKLIAHLPAHGSIDQVVYDPILRIAYAFEGGAKGFDAYNMNTMKPIAFTVTGVPLTHTGDVDPTTHKLYAFAGKTNVLYVYQPELGSSQ